MNALRRTQNKQPPYYTDAEIAAVLTHGEVIATLDAAYADLAQGGAAIMPRMRCSAGAAKFASMGGLWSTKSVAATKSYATVDGHFSFLISLFDTAANQATAVMAAEAITRFRTSGQTALVASRLGLQAVSQVTLFGGGVQGRAQVEALSRRVAFARLVVVDPALNQPPQLDLACAATVALGEAQAAVDRADIVITATRSQQPVFDGAWLKPQAFVVAIGISSASGRELDDTTFERANRVILEWMPQSLIEAGDVIAWQKTKGADHAAEASKLVDLPALYASKWPECAGIQVFKSVGTGLADCAIAWLAAQRLVARG